MRVVSNQSDAEIRRRETRERLTYPLRELTANLLRITRGGGKTYLLAEQLAGCFNTIKDYADAHGSFPSDAELHEILDYEAAWNDYRPSIKENHASFPDRRPTLVVQPRSFAGVRQRRIRIMNCDGCVPVPRC